MLVETPSKIIAIGRNYRDHAKELGNEAPKEPIVFLKPPSSIIDHETSIIRPDYARVDYEGELAVLIGKGGKTISASQAMSHISGYTCANDITVRDLQRSQGPWSLAKGMDTFCPIGPAIASDIDPDDLRIITRVNGKVRQDGRTSQMIFPISELIAYVSRFMTLVRGDLLLTGTPAGVGNLDVGDRVEVEIDGIGILANPVIGA